jgi:hypothetical protein
MSRQRYDRLQQLKQDAAAQFELPIDSERVSIIAGLRMHHEALQERMCAGRAVSTADLLEVAKAIADLSPSPQQRVEIAFVEGLVGICPHCKAEVHPYEPPQALTRPLLSTETKDISKTETAPPPKPSASNILEMRPRSSHDGA